MRLLASDVPNHYESLARELSGLRVSIATDGGQRDICFDRSDFRVTDADGLSDVEVAFEAGTVLALIDGHTTLEDAVLADELFVRGPVDAVERLFSAVVIYVNGSLRSNGFLQLLTGYRNAFKQQP